MLDLEDLKYPAGRFKKNLALTSDERKACIEAIADCPDLLLKAVGGFSEEQFDTAYREGGWTVRQLVHHMFDSHANAFIRFRLALTEPNPLIKAYDQNAWAHLPDSILAPADISVRLLKGLHERWVIMLKEMTLEQFARTMEHPQNGPMSLDVVVQMYAWHGHHHVRHITALSEREGW